MTGGAHAAILAVPAELADIGLAASFVTATERAAAIVRGEAWEP